MKILKICSDYFFAGLIAIAMMITLFSAFALNAYAEHDETVSGTAVRAVTTGGENRLSFMIGIAFLAIGSVGFLLVKLREKRLNDDKL